MISSFTQRKFGANGFYASPAYKDQYEEIQTSLMALSSSFVAERITVKPRLYWRRNQDMYLFLRQDPAYYRNLHLSNKIEFETYLPLIFFMIIGTGLMNYSLIYHFKLYIFHKDKSLLKVMVVSALLSLILTIMFTFFFVVYVTASAFLISCIILFFMRFKEAKKMSYD